MKRGLLITTLIVSLLLSSFAWGAPWYVDPDDGDDDGDGSLGVPYQTIKRALDDCSSGDTIELMDGNFVEAARDTSFSGSGAWDNNVTWRLQIAVNKSNVTIRQYSGTPSIIGYDSEDDLNYIMRIDNTTVKVQNIKFDGYNVAASDTVEVNDAIYITPDADSTEVTNCDFTHFGNDRGLPGQYLFYAIIAAGKEDTSGPVNHTTNLVINDNNFYSNLFESQGAHEIYMSETTDSEIKRNDITNNGAGHPIKFRDDCTDITFDSNIIRGAHFCFVGDYPNSGESNSSSITITNNSFIDPNSVIDTATYFGPFRNPDASAFISVYNGNSVVKGGDREWEVRSVTTDGSKLFMCYRNTHSTSAVEIHLIEFGQHNGPIFDRIPLNDKPMAYKASGYDCDGSMSYIGNEIFGSTDDDTNIRVYKVNSSTAAIDSTYFTDTLSDIEVTAMCPYPDDERYFITAVKEKFMGVWESRIYKSSADSLKSYLIYFEDADDISEITAVGVTGSTLIFGTDEGSGVYKIYSGSIPTSGYISKSQRDSLDCEVTGLTYLSSTLMTAVKDGSDTKIYSGTTTNPTDTLENTYTNTDLISLESDSEFIFMVKDDSGVADEKRTVFFTNSTTDCEQDTLYHSKWYTSRE